MFINVRLLTGFSKILTYRVPPEYTEKNLVGRLVQVPLRNRLVHALVQEQFKYLKKPLSFTIKELDSLDTFPDDKKYLPFITQLSDYQQIERTIFLKRLQQFLTLDEQREMINQNFREIKLKHVILTEEQQKVYDFLKPKISSSIYSPTLLHGVTGSGKTEIYKKLMTTTFAHQKTTIILLPEVTLALQFEQNFRQTLAANIPIFSFHSGTTKKEKNALWQAVLKNKPLILIGVHLPVLLPMSNLGLIIIDEEHETGYQEKKHPKINTKEAAIMRAKHYQIPILLGSATPSLSSLYNVKMRKWYFFQLKKRYTGTFPKIQIVQLTKDKNKRHNFWISKELEKAIRDRLIKKEQIIIFLNRRGICFFVQCKNCSHIFNCRYCSVSLTLHQNNELHCHYCGKMEQLPTICPQCKEHKFLKKGIGTQQIVTILEKMFPHACIARADLDATIKKKGHTIKDFQEQKINILVGTQTITKGYHFPHVTLVGILWADLNLHFPIFNASETTLQQLIQVAGRSGRENDKSLVIVQTMADHEIFKFINEIDYLKFYRHEIDNRQLLSYPPCGHLVEIELIHKDENVVEIEAKKLTSWLLNNKDQNITILGPTTPAISKIKNKHRRKIYLKSDNFLTIIKAYQKILSKTLKSRIYFTPNPN